MEKMLKHIRGHLGKAAISCRYFYLKHHLVLHPTHFLEGEDDGENFLFNADK